MKNRTTPENIVYLDVDDVFVFGSNESGRHYGGAAATAFQKFDAVYGIGFGRQGNSFAIPTLDWNVDKLSLRTIAFYVRRFIKYARINKNETFYVTKIGCGIAGYTFEEIAPLFKGAKRTKNIFLPKEFWEILNQ